MEIIQSHRCFGGVLHICEHSSNALKGTMRFSIFLPPAAAHDTPVPYVTFLSGLTCTYENFTTKAGAYAAAASLGLAILAPDTSPRADDAADDAAAHDLGKGAGFYIDATQTPWASHYRMEHYIAHELAAMVPAAFPVKRDAQGIMGHSMGGHGALTLFFKYPHLYRCASAFAPIVAPSQVPWGQKAFTHYLGDDPAIWMRHDACALVHLADNPHHNSGILIDQGTADPFLQDQLKPELFEQACQAAGQALTLRRQDGYDHSYYFIQSFIADHLRHHAGFLF